MNMKLTTWLFFAVLAPGGYASEPQKDEVLTSEQLVKMHTHIDANKDGKISMEEVIKFSEAMIRNKKMDKDSVLKELDTDKDGKVSLVELLKEMEEHHKMEQADENDKEKERTAREHAQEKQLETVKFNAADQDKNGFLSLAELPLFFHPDLNDAVEEEIAKSTMQTRDTNGDGELSHVEFWQLVGAGAEEYAEDHWHMAEFHLLDEDGSGKISLQELKGFESASFHIKQNMKEMFHMADTDKDDMVSVAELEKVSKEMPTMEAHDHFAEWLEHSEL